MPLTITGNVSITGNLTIGNVVPIPPNPPVQKTVLITDLGASAWQVPYDWSSNNVIRCIGGGGSGRLSDSADPRAGAGGGGAFASLSNVSLTPGQIIYIRIGAGGAAQLTTNDGADGQNTWVNFTTNSQPTANTDGVFAQRGIRGTFSGGNGGDAASCIGTFNRSGGDGGTGVGSSGGQPGAGGGGAAGNDLRAGGLGGDAGGSSAGTSGGGGGGTGTNGSSASNAAPLIGGQGGNAYANSSTGGVPVLSGPGGAGSNGAGGAGGGYSNAILGGYAGGAGGNGAEYVIFTGGTAGSGGGGGGSGRGTANAAGNGGDGGLFGGGGGGCYDTGNLNVRSGAGAQGAIIITYTGY